MANKIITNYSNYTDEDLSLIASQGIKGCTGNAYFTFVNNELKEATAAEDAYFKALSGIVTGTRTAVTAKNVARENLLEKIKLLTTQINIQAAGDLQKLQTCGFPVGKDPKHHQGMGVVANFKVERSTNAGTMKVSVKKPIYSNRGTIFAFWDPKYGEAPANINDWFWRHSNGHKLVLKGLSVGKTYFFAAAYKGSDKDTLIWSAVVSKMVGD